MTRRKIRGWSHMLSIGWTNPQRQAIRQMLSTRLGRITRSVHSADTIQCDRTLMQLCRGHIDDALALFQIPWAARTADA